MRVLGQAGLTRARLPGVCGGLRPYRALQILTYALRPQVDHEQAAGEWHVIGDIDAQRTPFMLQAYRWMPRSRQAAFVCEQSGHAKKKSQPSRILNALVKSGAEKGHAIVWHISSVNVRCIGRLPRLRCRPPPRSALSPAAPCTAAACSFEPVQAPIPPSPDFALCGASAFLKKKKTW